MLTRRSYPAVLLLIQAETVLKVFIIVVGVEFVLGSVSVILVIVL